VFSESRFPCSVLWHRRAGRAVANGSEPGRASGRGCGVWVAFANFDVMAKRRHRMRTGVRTTPKGTRPADSRYRRPTYDDAGPVPELVAGIRPLLAARTAFDLLVQASGFVEIATARPMDRLGPARMERIDGPEFLGSLIDSGWPELIVLGKAMATLLPDRAVVRRLRSQALPSGAPAWASTMDAIEITGTFVQTEPLGDGENMWVCVRWPDGSDATAIMFVDHNMGTLLKDAFLIPAGADEVMATMHDVSADVIDLAPIDPAELRACVVWSIERGDRTVPVIETETWPMCRPLVEWIVGHLPAGGRGWEFPEWAQAKREELIDDFVASPFAKRCPLPTDRVASIVDHFIWHGCEFGSGDPLRWSPVVVELVLADWFPRKIYGLTKAEVDAVPAILEQFVSYAHDRRGIDAQATNETLSAIVVWEDDFFEAMVDQAPKGSFATSLTRTAIGPNPDDPADNAPDGDALLRAVLGDQSSGDYMDSVTNELEQRVIQLVGGRNAYDTLDDEPLGDVAFDWSVVPADMAELTRDTLELLDRWSIEHFDAEVRSIARVTLAAVVMNDRSMFKRSARTDVLAAAILGYQTRRLTDRFNRTERESLGWTATSVSPFAEAVGLTPATVGARVKTITNVMERAEVDWPKYLHSTQRRTALESRQNIIDYRASAADHD
jgi:hypothetical protein